MIVATADRDLDLKAKEAAASMARPAAGPGKKQQKEACASKRRVPLARLPPNDSTAEARPAGAGKRREQQATAEKKMGKKRKQATAEKKMKEAVASESKDKEEGDRSLFKEGVMLKLREELWEAERLWDEKLVPGALDRWLEKKKTQVPVATDDGKKKKKVVREIFPDGFVDRMMANPDMMPELSDEEMARCHDEEDRQTYGITKVINDKNRVYLKAVFDQYRAFGYAYDEKEVTDDEEVVEKN